MYPLRHPHGASVSGLMTLSSLTVDSARRVELPIENSLMKLVDLDRCYSVHRIRWQTAASWCCITCTCRPTPPTAPSPWSS